MNASVKIMNSYDYSHFEICLSEEVDLLREVNEMRKHAQRLVDEAIRQYKKAKEMAAKREGAQFERGSFLERVADIQKKPEGERTINEIAILKQYEDEKWDSQFDYDYDYEDNEL